MSSNGHKPAKRLRFAIYARYSSDMQNEISLEDQEACCRQAIVERGGVVVAVYKDGAKDGWSLDRDGFQEMRAAASRGKFDAVMMWKFDRLAREHNQAVMVKMLLRREYGLKLYCVEGFSEDDDDSPYAALMEQMLAVFAAFYSRNLSTDTKRAKKQRAVRGEYNGSRAPLGYTLVLLKDATDDRPAGLYIDPRIAAIVRRAFRLYATGRYSDAEIATWMNQQRAIHKLRKGQQPVNKETVRDMLQNRLYTGRVPYAETLYRGTLGEGKQSSRGRREWYEGKHQGFISDDLFERCQEVRKQLATIRKAPSQHRTYILHDRVYCAECIANMPHGLVDERYGKMQAFWHRQNEKAYYRCRARERGYEPCGQGFIDVDSLDEQVVAILSALEIPEDYKERVESAVRSRVENEAALQRMEEINAIIERIDFRWDQGFISQDEYIEKRQQLGREIDSLRPIDYDQLIEAADLISNFRSYWDQCENLENPLEARKQLLRKIVERVFVHDGQVLAVVLHGDFGVVLGKDDEERASIAGALQIKMATSMPRSQIGSDGIRTRDLRLDRPAC